MLCLCSLPPGLHASKTVAAVSALNGIAIGNCIGDLTNRDSSVMLFTARSRSARLLLLYEVPTLAPYLEALRSIKNLPQFRSRSAYSGHRGHGSGPHGPLHICSARPDPLLFPGSTVPRNSARAARYRHTVPLPDYPLTGTFSGSHFRANSSFK